MKASPPRCSAALAACLVVLAPNAYGAEVTVVAAGDGQKACTALADEINTLSASEAKAAKRAETGRKFLGLAGATLQAAAPLLGGGKLGGGQGGYAAQQALGAFQQQAMQQQQQQMRFQMQQQMAQAYGATPGMSLAPQAPAQAEAAPSTPGSQRLAHLKGIFAEKGC